MAAPHEHDALVEFLLSAADSSSRPCPSTLLLPKLSGSNLYAVCLSLLRAPRPRIASPPALDAITLLLTGTWPAPGLPSLRALAGEAARTGVCGTVWKHEELAYKCKTCERDPTCAICVSCFRNGNHEGHDFAMIRTGGGCCDCGDVQAWKPSGFCSNHRGASAETDDPARPMTPELRDSLKQTVGAVSTCVLAQCQSFFEEIRRKDRKARARRSDGLRAPHRLSVPEVARVVKMLEWMGEVVNCGDGIRRVVGIFLTQGENSWLSSMLRLDGVERLPSAVQGALHALYYQLITDLVFKRAFLEMFVENYHRFVHALVLKKRDRGGLSSRSGEDDDEPRNDIVDNFSVQLFTVPALIPVMMRQGGILDVLINMLLHLFETASLPALPYAKVPLEKSEYKNAAWTESLNRSSPIPPTSPGSRFRRRLSRSSTDSPSSAEAGPSSGTSSSASRTNRRTRNLSRNRRPLPGWIPRNRASRAVPEADDAPAARVPSDTNGIWRSRLSLFLEAQRRSQGAPQRSTARPRFRLRAQSEGSRETEGVGAAAGASDFQNPAGDEVVSDARPPRSPPVASAPSVGQRLGQYGSGSENVRQPQQQTRRQAFSQVGPAVRTRTMLRRPVATPSWPIGRRVAPLSPNGQITGNLQTAEPGRATDAGIVHAGLNFTPPGVPAETESPVRDPGTPEEQVSTPDSEASLVVPLLVETDPDSNESQDSVETDDDQEPEPEGVLGTPANDDMNTIAPIENEGEDNADGDTNVDEIFFFPVLHDADEAEDPQEFQAVVFDAHESPTGRQQYQFRYTMRERELLQQETFEEGLGEVEFDADRSESRPLRPEFRNWYRKSIHEARIMSDAAASNEGPIAHTMRIDKLRNLILENVCWRVIYDLRYVLTHIDVARHLVHHRPDLFRLFVRILSILQGMNPVRRHFGSHVRLEDESWSAAFTFEVEFFQLIQFLVAAFCKGPLPDTPCDVGFYNIPAGQSAGARRYIHSDEEFLSDAESRARALATVRQCLDEWVERERSLESKSIYAGEEFSVAHSVSVHLPLHRLLSLLAHHAVRLDNVDAAFALSGKANGTSIEQALDILRHPLRVQVFLAQVRSGMWKRNGKVVVGQAMLYRSIFCAEWFVDMDIFLQQLCAVVAGEEVFVRETLAAFQIVSFPDFLRLHDMSKGIGGAAILQTLESFQLISKTPVARAHIDVMNRLSRTVQAIDPEMPVSRSSSSPRGSLIGPDRSSQTSLGPDAVSGTLNANLALGEYVPSLVEDILSYFIHISAERARCGMDDEKYLRWKLVHLLSFSDQTHSQLLKACPRRLLQAAEVRDQPGTTMNENAEGIVSVLIEETLSAIATFSRPRGMQQGKYVLKDEIWTEFDRFAPQLSARERGAAEVRYLAVCRRNNISPLPFPVETTLRRPLHDSLGGLRYLPSLLCGDSRFGLVTLLFEKCLSRPGGAQALEGAINAGLHLTNLSVENITPVPEGPSENISYQRVQEAQSCKHWLVSQVLAGSPSSKSCLDFVCDMYTLSKDESNSQYKELQYGLERILVQAHSKGERKVQEHLALRVPGLLRNRSSAIGEIEDDQAARAAQRLQRIREMKRRKQESVMAMMRAKQDLFEKHIDKSSNERDDAVARESREPQVESVANAKSPPPSMAKGTNLLKSEGSGAAFDSESREGAGVCALCREGPSDDNSVMGLLGFVQKTRIPHISKMRSSNKVSDFLRETQKSTKFSASISNTLDHDDFMTEMMNHVSEVHGATHQTMGDQAANVEDVVEIIGENEVEMDESTDDDLADAFPGAVESVMAAVERVEGMERVRRLIDLLGGITNAEDFREAILAFGNDQGNNFDHEGERHSDGEEIVHDDVSDEIAEGDDEMSRDERNAENTEGIVEMEVDEILQQASIPQRGSASERATAFLDDANRKSVLRTVAAARDKFMDWNEIAKGVEDANAVHFGFCGHSVHAHCFQRYFSSLQQSHASHMLYIGFNVVNLARGEFYCPICRRLVNILLPISEEENAHKSWDAVGKMSAADLKTQFVEWMRSSHLANKKRKLLVKRDENIRAERVRNSGAAATSVQERDVPVVSDDSRYHIDADLHEVTHSYSNAKDVSRFGLHEAAVLVRFGTEFHSSAGRNLLFYKRHPEYVPDDELIAAAINVLVCSVISTIVCAEIAARSSAWNGAKSSSERDRVGTLIREARNQCGALPEIRRYHMTILWDILCANDSRFGQLRIDAFSGFVLLVLLWEDEIEISDLYCILRMGYTLAVREYVKKHSDRRGNTDMRKVQCDVLLYLRRIAIFLSCYLCTELPIASYDEACLAAHEIVKVELEVLQRALHVPCIEELMRKGGNYSARSAKRKQQIEAKGPSQHFVPQAFGLLPLPPLYQDLLESLHLRQCKICDSTPPAAVLCLACGDLVCKQWKMCKGHIAHAAECGAGVGVFLVLKSISVIIYRDSRFARWGSPYLDEHGEEDEELKRGKPLHLSMERYRALENLWLSHGFDHDSRTLNHTRLDSRVSMS